MGRIGRNNAKDKPNDSNGMGGPYLHMGWGGVYFFFSFLKKFKWNAIGLFIL